MTDIASIGFKMETDDVARGIKSLETLAQQGPKVEKALDGVEKTAAKAGKSLKSIGEGAGKGLDDVGRAAPKAADGIGRVAKSADDAKRALAGINASAASLGQVAAAATQSARGMAGFSSTIQASQKSLVDMQAQVRAASAAVAQMGSIVTSALPSMQAAARAQMDAAKSAADMGSAFKAAGDQVRAYSTASARATESSQKTAKALDGTAAAARGLGSALAVAGVGFGAQELIAMVDGYTKYTSQLKLATKSTTDHAIAMSSVNRIATDAQQGLGEVGTLYARIANGTAELGLSQSKLANITETVALSLKVSGAAASESSSAMLQLSQAFASGVLRGEEFNSVNEAAPRLMKALADGLNVPVGALRKMAEEGKITSAVLAEALPKALGQLREEAKSVQTISGAFTVLKNNIMEMVGAQSNASGTTKALASGINGLANNLDLVAAAGAAVAVVIGARLTASIAASGVAFAASAIQAARYQAALASMAGVSRATATGLVAMGAAARGASAAMAFVGGPIGAVVAVAGLAATAFYAFGESAGALTESVGGLSQPLDDLKKKIDALPPEKRIAIVLDIKEEAQKKAKEAASSFDDLAASMVGAFSYAGSSSAESAKKVNELVDRLENAKKTGADMTPILRNAAAAAGVSNSTLKSWLELAANIRAARDAAKVGNAVELPGAGGGRGSVNPETVAEKEKRMAAEREAAAQRMLEISARQSGITKQFTEDLAANAEALRTGAIQLPEYVANVARLNQERYESTKAGKEAAKSSREGAGAAKAEQSTYASLIASIKAKIAANDAELFAAGKLTESQKLRVQLQAQLDSGSKKLSAAHRIEAKGLLDKLKTQEDEEKAIKRAISLNDERVASAEEMAKAMADLDKQVDAARLSIHEYSVGVQDSIEMTNLEASTLGMNAVARQTLIEQLRIEQDLRQRIQKIKDAPYKTEEARQADIDKITAEAMKAKANAQTKAYVSEWEKAFDQTSQALTDALMRGGKDGGELLRDYFRTLILRPVIKAIVDPIAAPITSGIQSMLGQGAGSGPASGGMAGGGFTDWSTWGSKASGWASDASFKLVSNGWQDMGSSMMGLSRTITSVDTYLKDIPGMSGGIGSAAGYLGALYSLSEGKIGSALGTAIGNWALPGIGTMIGGVLGGLLDGLDDSGTQHKGAGAIYSKATGVQTGAGIYNQASFGMGHRDEYSAEMQAGISGIAQGLGQTLDAFAVSFGKTAGYSVATAFADDSSKDGSWGSLKIADELGQVLINWDDTRASKWAPREFADGEAGYKEYLNAVAVDVKNAFVAMDLPAWADQILTTATDIDTLNTALQQIATVKTVFEGLGKTMAMFSGITDDVQTRLLAASGGVEALGSNAGAFYESFYTEGERALKQRELQMAALGRMGLYIDPAQGDAAKELFRKTVEEAMGSGQVELAAQLLAMSGAFAQTADYAQGLVGSVESLAASLVDLRGPLIDLEARFAGGGNSRQYLADDTATSLQGLLSGAGIQMQASDLASILMSATSADVEHYFREIWKVLPTDAAKTELVGLASTMMDLAAATDAARESAAQAAAQSMSGAWSNFGTMAGLAAQYTGNTSGLSQQMGVVQGSYANATTTDGRVAALQQIINLEQGLWNGQQAARQAEAAAATARANAAREQVNAAKQLLSTAQGLGTYAKSLGFSEASGLGEAERLAALDSERRDLLAKARAGDTGAMQDLQGVTGNYLTLAQQMAVSQQDYSVLSGRIAAELAATAAIQEASASSQVSQYERQIAAAESVASSAAEQFKVSAATQKLIDDLLVESATAFETEATLTQKLIDQGVMTTAALQSLPAELAGAIGASLIPAIAGLASAMSSAAGISVPQFAEGGFHVGGLRIVGERGPELEATGPSRVWNQAQLAGALGGNNNAALVAAVDRLTAQNARMAAELAEIKASTAKFADQFDQVTAGGNAMATEAFA